MKYKSYKAEVMEIAEKGIVTIALSRFDNEDMGGDIARKGAFARTFKEGINRIKHYLDHQLKYSALVGLPVKMWESDTHAIAESALNIEKQSARDLFSDYKFYRDNGRTLEHSFGYLTTKGKARARGEEILELKMFEYSTVGMGMNPETPLLDLKSFDEGDISALETHLRKYDVTNTKGAQIESIIKQIKELQGTHNPGKPSTHNPVELLNEVLTEKKFYE